jgi:hypothetical protein
MKSIAMCNCPRCEHKRHRQHRRAVAAMLGWSALVATAGYALYHYGSFLYWLTWHALLSK